MSVEIKEMIIRAVIDPLPETEIKPKQGVDKIPNEEAMIQQCVNKVLKILSTKKER